MQRKRAENDGPNLRVWGFGFRPRRVLCLSLACLSESLTSTKVLYQAYWPESLITPPSEEAMLQDLHRARKLG